MMLCTGGTEYSELYNNKISLAVTGRLPPLSALPDEGGGSTATLPSFFVGLPLQVLDVLLRRGEPSPERAGSEGPTASLKRARVVNYLICTKYVNTPGIRWFVCIM